MLQTVQPELTWNASSTPSAIHCSIAIVAGKTLPEIELQQAMLPAAAALQAVMEKISVGYPGSTARCVRNLLVQSARNGFSHDSTAYALRKSLGYGVSPELENEVRQFVSLADRSFRSRYPAWREMIGLLNKSQRITWKSVGLKLLNAATWMTDAALVPEAAEFTILCKAGIARPYIEPLSNVALFEFIEGESEVTTAMQMVWLLLTLNLELDQLHGGMKQADALQTGRLALVPAILAAADAEGLATFSRQEVQRLLSIWKVTSDPQTHENLMRWWEVYNNRRPSWPTAMMGLNQFLSSNA